MNKELKITLRVDAKTGEVTAVRNSFDALERSAAKTTDSLKGVRYALAGIASALYVNKIIAYADTYTSLNSQLKLATDSSREFQEVQKEMLSIANDARMQLGGTVDLYAKLKRSTEELGYAQNTLLDVTESITKAMIISGGPQESMNAAIIQLGQGLASGVLRGEELNSVMEQTPRLAQAIAEGMGVGIGELRALAQEGKITSKVVIDALMSQAATIDKEFSEVSMTVSQAMTVAENTMTVLVGQIDTAAGASSGLAKGIVSVTQALLDNKTLVMDLTKQVLVLGGAFAVLRTGKLLSPLIGELKLTSDAFKVQMALAKMDGVALGTLDKIALETSISMKALGSAVKSFALANAPMLALVAVFEAWNYVAGQSAERERELSDAMNIHADAAERLTRAQAQNNLYILQEELKVHRETTQELLLQLKMARGRSYEQNEETVAIRAKLDTVKEESDEIKKQIALMQQVVDGTYEADAAATATANSAADTANNIAAAAQNAYELASALGNAMVSLEKESIRAQQLSGEISKRKALALSADADIRNIDAQMQALSNLYAQKNANIDKLNTKAIQLAAQRLRVENNLTESLSKEENKRLKTVNKTHAAAVTSAKKMAAERKKAAEEYAEALRKAEETLEESRLYNLGGDELVKINQLGDKLADLGKYLTQAELAEIYDAEIGKMKQSTDSLADKLQSIFGIGNDSVFADIFSGVVGSLDSIGDALRSGGDALGSAIGSLFNKSLDFIMPGLSGIASLIGGIFSDMATQEEIDAATGRVDFTDESINKMGDMFSSALNPQLEATYMMSKYLRDMNKSFGVIARSLVTNNNLDITGAEYEPYMSSGTLGFSSKSISLLGSGLYMAGTIGDIVVTSYISELVEKSSWWGLKKSSYTTTSYYHLPDSTIAEFDNVVNAGVAQIITAGVALGFDSDSILSQLESYSIDIGKINLTGLTDSEINDKLSNVFSEIFSGAIAEVDGINELVATYARTGEENLETLTRIATDYEQISYSLGSIGINIADNLIPDYVTKLEEVTVTTTTSVLNPYYNWWSYMSLVEDQYTEVTTTTTELVETIVEDYYTATEKILDIAAAFDDGMDGFNDAYNSYVENFFSESEQIAMLTDSLTESFSRLGVELPQSGDAYRDLVNEMSQFTDEAGAEAFAEVLKLSDAFAALNDAMERSNDNIRSYEELFMSDGEILRSHASDYGVIAATTYEQLGAIFDNLSGGVEGLSDAELSFLNDNKDYIDTLTGMWEDYDDAVSRSRDSVKGIFDTIASSSLSLIDQIKGESQDDTSFKFYAERYNDLKSEYESYYDNGVIRSDADLESMSETYASLMSVASSLSSLDQYNQTDINDYILSDAYRYYDMANDHSDTIDSMVANIEILNTAMADSLDAIVRSNDEVVSILNDIATYSNDTAYQTDSGYLVPVNTVYEPVIVDTSTNTSSAEEMNNIVTILSQIGDEIIKMRKEIQDMKDAGLDVVVVDGSVA